RVAERVTARDAHRRAARREVAVEAQEHELARAPREDDDVVAAVRRRVEDLEPRAEPPLARDLAREAHGEGARRGREEDGEPSRAGARRGDPRALGDGL